MTIRRTTAALLAAAALGAPATASARSGIEPPPASQASIVQADMHASVAQAAAAAHGGQDLRSPDARDAAAPVVRAQDLRSPDARDAAGRPVADASAPERSAWPSTAWSVTTPEPAAAALPADDGTEWSELVLGIGGALLLAGGLALAAARSNRRRIGV
jgi:hypothetical protein